MKNRHFRTKNRDFEQILGALNKNWYFWRESREFERKFVIFEGKFWFGTKNRDFQEKIVISEQNFEISEQKLGVLNEKLRFLKRNRYFERKRDSFELKTEIFEAKTIDIFAEKIDILNKILGFFQNFPIFNLNLLASNLIIFMMHLSWLDIQVQVQVSSLVQVTSLECQLWSLLTYHRPLAQFFFYIFVIRISHLRRWYLKSRTSAPPARYPVSAPYPLAQHSIAAVAKNPLFDDEDIFSK